MWSLATHTRTLTVSQDTIKGRKSSPKDVGRGGGYYTHPYDPFIFLGGEGDVEWTFKTSKPFISPNSKDNDQPIFFLRLPNGQYDPVSQLSWSEKCCTGPFNWGGAHCAGENVKRRTGPFLRKSLRTKQEQQHNKKGAARHGNQEPSGQACRCTGQESQPQQTRDFTDRSRYALTYIEMS